ncbi:hypothetical protein C5167_028408 [Papaver somniferum]|nr:hypothetical protein C5167_028408 [Papaver somniferum]
MVAKFSKSSKAHNFGGTLSCSEPDMRTGVEAAEYAAEIQRLVRYLRVGNGNTHEGSLRCDVNVSVRPIWQAEFRTKPCTRLHESTFEEAELPLLKAEKPGLTHTQYKDLIWKGHGRSRQTILLTRLLSDRTGHMPTFSLYLLSSQGTEYC